jgi:tetratricopeptide (TPR) repeat protein
VAAGDAAVAARDLQAAKAAYQRASEIDPGLAIAREKLRDTDAGISSQAYQSAVSEAVARLREGNTKAAEAALARAQQVRPNAPELAELRTQIAAASKLSEIRRLQGVAEAMERQEKWPEAAKTYEQVLALDASAAFAGRGLEQARHLAALHGLIDGYLGSPDRLKSSEPRSHAQAVLGQATSAESGPVLRGKANRLTELLAAAQAPVPVTLRSDNATQVEILRVGPVGTFERHSLSLIPGRYTAVGRRTGYRDVRVQFEVAPTEQLLEVVVQCIERIR